ncbi:DNA-3-methyladenine glycosylase family protein [Nitratireductor basaltis]|uniref:DNA-3-methyladenine glycosylase II n=1 Tax=Nitratireductor basaltis TaxID=472175 RepID=A0A084U7M3_9HYPH|nr:DNA-3-methyladenine glycosylase [Nitratireductor basaltis]KFB08959.1 DNA-3-methyladenine glycosidase II [Nitratireductor basaltis]
MPVRIETLADVATGLDALEVLDPRLARVRQQAGEVDLRLRPAGFTSLASIIVSQQVSLASASAIMRRLCLLIEPLEAGNVLAAGEPALVQAGLSRAKQKALLALAQSVVSGGLDLEALCACDAEDAIAAITALPGLGPWSAQVYLLSCAGHADVFPAGDVALQVAVQTCFELQERPKADELAAMAESWRPWRSVAARLFWAFYREMKGREAKLPAFT